jgi:hypothetical protein
LTKWLLISKELIGKIKVTRRRKCRMREMIKQLNSIFIFVPRLCIANLITLIIAPWKLLSTYIYTHNYNNIMLKNIHTLIKKINN